MASGTAGGSLAAGTETLSEATSVPACSLWMWLGVFGFEGTSSGTSAGSPVDGGGWEGGGAGWDGGGGWDTGGVAALSEVVCGAGADWLALCMGMRWR